jgi:hypothetical protein
MNFEPEWHKAHERCADLDPFDLLVYVVRHPLAVLRSNFAWWFSSGEAGVSNISSQMKEFSFDDYLAGKIRIENIIYLDRGVPETQKHWFAFHFEDPVQCWKSHVYSYVGRIRSLFSDDLAAIVKYENVCEDPETELQWLGELFKLAPKHDKFRIIGEKVGHFGNSKVYPEVTAEHEEFVYSKASDLMHIFGYAAEIPDLDIKTLPKGRKTMATTKKSKTWQCDCGHRQKKDPKVDPCKMCGRTGCFSLVPQVVTK